MFELCRPGSVDLVHPDPSYLVVVDEAQGLTKVLKGKLGAHRPSSSESRRAFLSSVVTASHGFMGGLKVILSGTDLVLADAVKAAESGVAASESDEYSRFQPFSASDVVAYLGRVAGVPNTPIHLAEALAGRPRFTTRFAENLIAQTGADAQSKSLVDLGAEFIDYAVRADGDQRRDIGGVVNKLRYHPGTGNILLKVKFPPATNFAARAPQLQSASNEAGTVTEELTGLFQTLRRAAYALCNGATATMQKKDAMALIEAGLFLVVQPATGSTEVNLEPMALLAFLRGHYEDAFLVERLRALENSASSMGFEFEWLVGLRLTCGWLASGAAFKDLPLIKAHAKHLPSWCADATVRAYEPRLGRVAEPGADFHTWFHRHLARACSSELGAHWGVMGKFPGRYAGPDFAMFVRVEKRRTASSSSAGPPAAPLVALVLVQVKLVSSVTSKVLKEARATVDPALVYHVNRLAKKKTVVLKARAAGQTAFLEALKTVPVVRMVIAAGGSAGKVEVSKVVHGRPGATYKEDLEVIVAGKAALVGLFGKSVGEAVFALKAGRDDDEEELAEEGYDDAKETQDWDEKVV